MSFLEKLRKSMPAADDENPNGDPASGRINQEPANEGNAAAFAAYKAKPKKGIPVLKETPPGGEKMITAANVDKITGAPNNSDNGQKAAKEKSATKTTTKKTMINKKTADQSGWLKSSEAQLAVNVFQTDYDLILQAAIAGVRVEDLDVVIEDDVINIKGNRPNPIDDRGDYFIEECYFGPFSRKVILPVEVDSGHAEAAAKDGILTIRIPKIVREKKKKVAVRG